MLLKVLEHLTTAQNLLGRNATYKRAGGFGADDGGDGLCDDGANVTGCLEDVTYALPATTVRGLVQTGVGAFLCVGILVQPHRILADEISDTGIYAHLFSPEKPFLDSRAECHHVEAAHQGRVQVGKLVLVTRIDCGDNAAPVRKFASCKGTVQGQVHYGLQHFRAGAVKLVQKQDDRLAVQREPVRRHELRLAGGVIAVGNADEVTGITHLAKEKRDDLHPFAGEVLGEDFGLADAMIADQHKILVGGSDVEEAQELRGGDIDVCHMSVL